MDKYTAKFGQSIYDICLQTYGTLSLLPNKESALFKLLNDNKIGNINEEFEPGKVFIFDQSLVSDISVFQNNQSENIFYVTLEKGKVSDNLIYRITEDGVIRMLENGQFRVIQ